VKIPSDPEGAKVPGGYVHLTRQIYESSLWTMPPYCRVVAITCLALANYQDKKWFCNFDNKEIIIKRGEFVTSIRKLAEYAKLPTRMIRLSLQKLKSHGFLKVTSKKNGYTRVFVVKYGYYNDPNTYMRSGFIGGVGTPMDPPVDPPEATPEDPPVDPRRAHDLSSLAVKKERKEEGTAPSDGFKPPRPVNAPEIFLTNQYHQYISDEIGKEKCAVCFKNALKRGLSSANLNAAIEAKWNEGALIWDWMKAFEKEHRQKEAKPKYFRASDDDKENKKEDEEKKVPLVPDDQRIKKELHDALMKMKLHPEKPNADQPEPSEKSS